MKTKKNLMTFAAAAVLAIAACDYESEDGANVGTISLNLSNSIFTKAVPDSSLFILEVKSSGGKTVYSGRYGDAPAVFRVAEGTYTVSIRSAEQKKPEFEAPVYGDSQLVNVLPGNTVNVTLDCTLQNCGVKLLIDESFIKYIPDGALVLKSKEGSLLYAYREQRIAYFLPGEVSLVLTRGGTDKTLITRTLSAREVLRLKVQTTEAAPESGISVNVDTSVNWLDDTYVIGGDGGTKVYDVATARGMEGASGVWVYGYIVGNISPFLAVSSQTNLAIAGKTSVTEKSACMSVELPKGALRDALNLVSYPGNLGRKLFVKGDIIKYYSIPGVKNISEWALDSPPF